MVFSLFQVHKRHNSDISLSTIAEETGSHLNTSLGQDTEASLSCSEGPEAGSVQSSYNGTSVFLEPHITVETSTLPVQVRNRLHASTIHKISLFLAKRNNDFILRARVPAPPAAPRQARARAR